MSAHYTSATNRIGPLSLIRAAIPLFGSLYFLFARLKAMLEIEVRGGRGGGGVALVGVSAASVPLLAFTVCSLN